MNDDEGLSFPLPDLRNHSPADMICFLFLHPDGNPYSNLISHFINETREYELGLEFVEKCRIIVALYQSEISEKEASRIDYHLVSMELAYLDGLNRWREYLDAFEQYFREKRSSSFIMRYTHVVGDKRSDQERFGRYLLGYDTDRSILVHSLYFAESQRATIERKQIQLEEGKPIEHLKRRSKEELSTEQLEKKYAQLQRYYDWMKHFDDSG